MKHFSSDGVFWLPQQPERRVAGRLTFDMQQGGQLSLIGSFSSYTDLFSPASDAARIVGVPGKRHFTLEDCFQLRSNLDSPGVFTQVFHVGRILAGAHFDAEEPLSFTAIAVTTSNMAEWVGRSGVTVDIATDAKARDLLGIP